jgi:hypothetical protein
LAANVNLINANITAANTAIAGIITGSGFATVGQLLGNALVANVAIASVQANVTAANASIITANTAMKSYVDSANVYITSAWTANAGTLTTAITTANTAVVNYVNTLNSSMVSNVTAANLAITNLQSNTGVLQNQINLINANVIAANAAIASIVINSGFATVANLTAANVKITNLQSNTSSLAANINSINANITGANIAIANQNTVSITQQSQIVTLQSQVYANANVAAYLPTYTGNVSAGNITATNITINSNVPTVSNIARFIWVSTAVPLSGQGSIGDIWYQTN